MAPPPLPSAHLELEYPLFAVDFDPQDANRVVVGGGAGAGRTDAGGNRVTVLEMPSQDKLYSVGELEFPREEDSVMSLAVGPRRGKSTYVYAGVNSSSSSIEKGKNEHLRTLSVEQAKGRSSTGNKPTTLTTPQSISEASRVSLFTDPDTATYQRLLRVTGGMGATASAMGKEPQLAVFEAAGPNPKFRGVMELPKEAEDLDIIQTGETQYQVAFCYKYEIYVVNVGKETTSPELVYTMPEENSVRPTIRAIRYLTPNFILAATNLPSRSGVVLQALRLPKQGEDNARLAASATINRAISATALAVTNLAPPASPTVGVGETQFAIAVAGNDSSINLFAVDHSTSLNITLLSKLLPLQTIKDAHDGGNISALAFSTFISPKTHLRPQFIRLASTCLEKGVAVHSIPLERYIDKSPRNKKGPPRVARYVVGLKPQDSKATVAIVSFLLSLLVLAFVGQAFLEWLGRSRPILGVQRFLPSRHGTLRSAKHPPPVLMEGKVTKEGANAAATTTAGQRLFEGEDGFAAELLLLLGSGKTLAEGQRIILTEGMTQDEAAEVAGSKIVVADVHDAETQGSGPAVGWKELSRGQREAWKQRLLKTGRWTEDMGEDVLNSGGRIVYRHLDGVAEEGEGHVADEL